MCEYYDSGIAYRESLPREGVEVTRQIAENDTTCELTLESAILSTSQASALGFDVKQETDIQPAQSWSYKQRSYFEDPPNIDVNSVTSKLQWRRGTQNGRTCVTWSNHASLFNKLTLTGWRLNDNLSSDWRYCTSTATHSYAYFSNSIFCKVIGGPWKSKTKTYHHKNNVRATNTNSVSWELQWSKSGGCSGLLSFSSERSWSW